MENIIELIFSKGSASAIITLLLVVVLFFSRKYISKIESSFVEIKESTKKIEESIMESRINNLKLQEQIFRLETQLKQAELCKNDLLKNFEDLNKKYNHIEDKLTKHEKAIATVSKVMKRTLEELQKREIK